MAAPAEQASVYLPYAHEKSLSGQIINPRQNQPCNNCLNQQLPLTEHTATFPLTSILRYFQTGKQPIQGNTTTNAAVFYLVQHKIGQASQTPHRLSLRLKI